MNGDARRRADDRGRFVWPPRSAAPVEPPKSIARAPAHRASPSTARGNAWAAFEREFLGLRAGPLRLRAAEAGWSPDRLDDYCPRCGRGNPPAADPTDGCHECAGIRFAWARIVRLGPYSGELARWIREVKFTGWRYLGFELGVMLGDSLLAADLPPPAGPTVIVPVPDSMLRRLFRGIDHAALIARGVSRATGWPIARLLTRRFGPTQLSVAASERASNAARSFRAATGAESALRGFARVVVVDDVLTTGATMRACTRAVASASRSGVGPPGGGSIPTIWAACLARSESR